jgi:hypothetical protein
VIDEKGGVAGEVVGEEAAPAWGRTEGERGSRLCEEGTEDGGRKGITGLRKF